VWGLPSDPTSMYSMVEHIPGVYVEQSKNPAIPSSTFDYESVDTHWVDDQAIGPQLAKDIACMAQSSRDNGGLGKVILVAHSMGGLAIRFAAGPTQVFDGIPVASDIGLVITIGTPNTGARFADGAYAVLTAICSYPFVTYYQAVFRGTPAFCNNEFPAMVDMLTFANAKVNSLPKLPKSIPVMAIAGNILSSWPVFGIQLPITLTDLVVTVPSAIAEANDPKHGGGVRLINCTAQYPIPGYSDGECEHTKLPTNIEVEDTVMSSIETYLDSIHPPCPTSSTSVCLGTRFADVDGDKLPDRVGVTYNPATVCNATFAFGKTCSITVYVVQGNGGYIVYPTQLEPYCFETCEFKVGFLGLTPMNGPGNDIVLSPQCSVGYVCPFVAYQVRNGQVQQVLFNGSRISPTSSRGDVGFVCSVVNGAYQVETFSLYAAGQANTDLDEVYQADATGNMNLVSSKVVDGTSVPYSERGPHCTGLKIPS